MTSQTFGLRVAGTIFGLIALGHLLRVVTNVEIVVAGYHVPIWLNVVAAVIAAGLSCWMWRLSGCCCAKDTPSATP